MIKNDTIIALATPAGVGAISVIRLSGENSIDIVDIQGIFTNNCIDSL